MKNVIFFGDVLNRYERRKWEILERDGITPEVGVKWAALDKRLEKLYKWHLISVIKSESEEILNLEEMLPI